MTCNVVRAVALIGAQLFFSQLPAMAETFLVSTGSVWKYLDTGVAPDASWTTSAFDDSAWSSGPAQLGFGDDDESTPLSPTSGSGEPIITYYFRQTFQATTASAYTNLLLRIKRDDGAIVYLNGLEVFRSNLSLGEVNPGSLAAAANDDGEVLFDVALSPSLVSTGPNVIAVEVHQTSATSSDLSFDLELIANVPRTLLPLVNLGAIWKYLDDGSNQGTTWTAPEFDDSGWSNGIAQFGFGEGDEATRIRQLSPVTGTNAITYYFRHSFNVANTGEITNLVARVVRDDGAIVYLNGTEIFRINMPTGTVTSATFAARVIGNDNLLHAIRVDPVLLRVGANVLAVEVHQFNLTSSDISFDMELRPNVAPVAPAVAIVSPVHNASFFGPTNLAVDVLASDFDNPISSVQFYVSGNLGGTDSSEAYDVSGRNYSQTLTDLVPGNYALTAVATDATGRRGTSAPVNISIIAAPIVTRLISSNSIWKYLDTGVNQGTAWQAPDFNDASWPSGPAKLGTNDSPNTVIRIRNAMGTFPTCYFRHYFTATNVSSFTNLAFRVLRDDGCVAYLNGIEIFRMNMPTGMVTFNTVVPTLDAVGGSSEFTFYPTNISPSFLINGSNVLAVELHQTQSTTDAGFALELSGVAPAGNGVPPLSIERVGAAVRISWSGTGFILQEAANVNGTYTNLPAATSPYPVTPVTGSRFFRLMRP